jgi:hypothetical protein
MKYLVVKGWLGFGDRLESLKMAVRYALDNNLQIYVDWTDRIWSHSSETFYTYFNLVNMPVLNSLDDIPASASVFPPYWKNKLKEPLTDELVSKSKELSLNFGMLTNSKKFDEDVIVYSSVSNRMLYDDSSFFGNVFRVIHPKIIQEVFLRQQTYNLSSSVGIHIRGTDRIKKKRGRNLPIQFLSLLTFSMARNKQQIVVSDDNESSTLWKSMNPNSIMLSSLSLKNSHKGALHELTASSLGDVTKDTMNIDMLIDFFTLCSCERVLSTYKDSRFAKEAERLHNYVYQIMGISPQTSLINKVVETVVINTLSNNRIVKGLSLRNGRFSLV